MLNLAHRGASGFAPEHTFAAYDLALSQGADYIELDVQMTRDGAIVVVHDRTLARTARGPASVRTRGVVDTTLAEIKRCEVGGWFNDTYPGRASESYRGLEIPTLDEVFSRYGNDVNFLIEVKYPGSSPGIEKALLEVIDSHAHLVEPGDICHRIVIQSFEPSALQKIHAMDGNLPLVQLYRHGRERLVRRSLQESARYAVGIAPSFLDASHALVSAAHDRGLLVWPYTVNSTSRMKRLIRRGVDGIITDLPGRLDGIMRGGLGLRTNIGSWRETRAG